MRSVLGTVSPFLLGALTLVPLLVLLAYVVASDRASSAPRREGFRTRSDLRDHAIRDLRFLSDLDVVGEILDGNRTVRSYMGYKRDVGRASAADYVFAFRHNPEGPDFDGPAALVEHVESTPRHTEYRWTVPLEWTKVDVLAVAGGGGGGDSRGGGGGAGGLMFRPGHAPARRDGIVIRVGAGGGAGKERRPGADGGDTHFGPSVVQGGGGGGGGQSPEWGAGSQTKLGSHAHFEDGRPGGSGGGGRLVRTPPSSHGGVGMHMGNSPFWHGNEGLGSGTKDGEGGGRTGGSGGGAGSPALPEGGGAGLASLQIGDVEYDFASTFGRAHGTGNAVTDDGTDEGQRRLYFAAGGAGPGMRVGRGGGGVPHTGNGGNGGSDGQGTSGSSGVVLVRASPPSAPRFPAVGVVGVA